MDTATKPDLPLIVRESRSGGPTRVSRTFTEQIGYAAAELAEKPLLEWIHPEDRNRFQQVLDQGRGALRSRHQARPSGWIAFDWQVRSEEHGPIVIGVLHDEPAEAAISRTPQTGRPDDSMSEILVAMALMIEDQHPGMKCSVLLLNEDGSCVSVGAGPSLPAEYNRAVEGLRIGPCVGSCGTAAYWNQRIIVEDIQNDYLWRDLKEHAASAGVGACWSQPIAAKSGDVLGAVALYNPEPRVPTQLELDRLAMAGRMFGLAIERGLADQALVESEADAQLQSRLLSAVTAVVTSFVDHNDWQAAGTQLVRAALDLTNSEYGFLGEVHGDELRVVSHEGVVWSVHEGREFYAEALRNYKEQGYLTFPKLDNLFGHVITSEQPVLSNDAMGDSRSANRLPAGHPALRNFLGAPINNGGEVVAMICVANRDGGYSDQDVRTAEFLCQAGSVVFDSYRQKQHESALEEQLQHAVKMEALGVLAGGLAHDFNNVLATALGNAELAMMAVPEGGQVHQMLREIVTASRGANELCNQMLAYAGRGVLSTQPLDCNGLIREFGGLLQVTLSKKATLEYELCKDAVFVEADKAQLGQVLMNLITNAAEALGKDTGRISVTTDTRFYDDVELQQLKLNATLKAGEYVRLTVADTGPGMTAETRAKIFDPFFTTKFTGRGLGLAAVQGIVLRHQGGIGLQSEVGNGTTFTVLLPRTDAPQTSPGLPEEITQDHADKRVLIVDDEPQVRKVLGLILESAGFEVVLAGDGREAIEIFREKKDVLDCVLLDLSMPELDGEETFHELQRIRGDIPVVLNSGFTEEEILNRFRDAGFAGVVQKPTPTKMLIAKIHEALG